MVLVPHSVNSVKNSATAPSPGGRRLPAELILRQAQDDGLLLHKARGAPVSRSAPLCSGHKPNSVPLRLLKAHRRWSFISRRDFSPPRGVFRRACDRYPRRAPEFPPRPGRRPGVSVWPCTAWGLSCPGGCPPGGGLLPRLFTLAATPVRAHCGGLFSVTLSIDRNFRPGPPRVFPRHAALWCSDFPLPPKRERPSTQRQSSRF